MFTDKMFKWDTAMRQWVVNDHIMDSYPDTIFNMAKGALESGEHREAFEAVMAETMYQYPWEFERRSGYFIKYLQYAPMPDFALGWVVMLTNDVDMWLQQIVCYMFIKQSTKIQDKWAAHYSKLFHASVASTYSLKK